MTHMKQFYIINSIVFITLFGFLNYFICLEQLNINRIKWFLNKSSYNIDDLDTLFAIDEYNAYLESNIAIKNSESILFIISYLWIIYMIYYESWVLLYPFVFIIKLKDYLYARYVYTLEDLK